MRKCQRVFLNSQPNAKISFSRCPPRPFVAYSQSGPGGVSSGATNVELWLDSRRVNNDGTNPIVGTEVVTWHDQSGNNVDVTRNQASVATYSATGVTFNNTGYLLGSETGFPTGNSPRSVIICASSPSTTEDDALFFYGTAGNNNCYGILKIGATNGVRGYFFGNDLDVAGGFTPVGTQKIITSTYQANSHSIYVNNGAVSTDAVGFPTNTTLGDGLQIGGWGEYAVTRSNATIAEVVFYNKLLNNVERIIVNNYLSAKYGLTLALNDLYDEDNAGLSFDFDVAGVGQAGAGATNTVAQSSIMTIDISAGDNNLGNNEYFIWGHDNGVLATTTTGVPGTVQRRLTRIWAGSETGAVTNFDVRFDLAGMGSVTVTDLRLLVDTDGDGSFTDGGGSSVLSGAMFMGGTTYQFSNVTIMNNNSRFTLGTSNATQTPLPVELISFTATPKKDHLQLSWKTVTETNNDYFEIQRSVDGIDWIALGPG